MGYQRQIYGVANRCICWQLDNDFPQTSIDGRDGFNWKKPLSNECFETWVFTKSCGHDGETVCARGRLTGFIR